MIVQDRSGWSNGLNPVEDEIQEYDKRPASGRQTALYPSSPCQQVSREEPSIVKPARQSVYNNSILIYFYCRECVSYGTTLNVWTRIVPQRTRVHWSWWYKNSEYQWQNVRHCFQFVCYHEAQRHSILARTAREGPSDWVWRPLWENCCCYWSQYRPRLRICETLCSNESRPNHSRMSKQRARRGSCHQWDQSAVLSYHFVSHYTYKELKTETGYKSAELWIIDLSRISSVVEFAERFEKDGGRIDILLLNAGTTPFPGQRLTDDGYEPVSVIRFYTV